MSKNVQTTNVIQIKKNVIQNTQVHFLSGKQYNVIAKLQLKYPNNQFFVYRLDDTNTGRLFLSILSYMSDRPIITYTFLDSPLWPFGKHSAKQHTNRRKVYVYSTKRLVDPVGAPFRLYKIEGALSGLGQINCRPGLQQVKAARVKMSVFPLACFWRWHGNKC